MCINLRSCSIVQELALWFALCSASWYTIRMNEDKKAEILAYIKNRLSEGPNVLAQMTKDAKGNIYPKRSIGLVIDKYLRDYKLGKIDPRWVAIPGLRGVGKTTLLAQTFTNLNCPANHKIYLTVDDIVRTLGVTIRDVLNVYEEYLGKPFHLLNSPVYIFLDEVHYDKDWGLTLKSIYDRTRKVFILCTGSSAISIHGNTDIARRVAITKIFPLSFVEYQLIKKFKKPIWKLGNNLKIALFSSKDAEEAYGALSQYNILVETYWSGSIDKKPILESEIDQYLKYGTLPFAANIDQEALIYRLINQTLSNVVNKDLPQIAAFDKSTINRLEQLLYIISSYDVLSFDAFSAKTQIAKRNLYPLFEALENSEVLVRVYPYGNHESQINKPSKFLFTSSAYRAMFYNLVGSIIKYDDYKGKLLEDTIALYFHRILYNNPASSMTYYYASNGADFIVNFGPIDHQKIIVEVGFGKNNNNQVVETMKRIKSRYGITLSNTLEPKLNKENNCLALPLKYFLLL